MDDVIDIIGAGLGGLTAALALLRFGQRVRVFEQAPVLGEVGAGISLSAGAGRGLAELGIGPEILAHSLPIPDVAFAHYRTGKLLAGRLYDGVPPDHGFETARHIHRADLHRILSLAVIKLDPKALQTNKKLVAIEQSENGVRAIFADGTASQSRLLVGADGTRSFVRRQLFDDPAPEFSGQVALRCLIPANAAAPFLSHGNAVVSVGAGRIFHRYALRGGQLINVVGIARSSTWHNEGWNTPATPAEFLDLYQDFHPDVTGLISVAPKDGLIKWGLFVRPPIQHWSAGRVVLLGDAAHPILPFLGLGAALAIEDGIILARVLANGFRDTGELRAFQRTRQSRVERVRVESIRQGEIIQSHDPEGAQLTTSPSQDRSVFDYDPFTAPIELSKIPL